MLQKHWSRKGEKPPWNLSHESLQCRRRNSQGVRSKRMTRICVSAALRAAFRDIMTRSNATDRIMQNFDPVRDVHGASGSVRLVAALGALWEVEEGRVRSSLAAIGKRQGKSRVGVEGMWSVRRSGRRDRRRRITNSSRPRPRSVRWSWRLAQRPDGSRELHPVRMSGSDRYRSCVQENHLPCYASEQASPGRGPDLLKM